MRLWVRVEVRSMVRVRVRVENQLDAWDRVHAGIAKEVSLYTQPLR